MFRALNLASVEIVLSQNGTSTGVHQPSNVLAKSSKKEADALLKLSYASSAREKKTNIENKYSLSSPMRQFIGKPLL